MVFSLDEYNNAIINFYEMKFLYNNKIRLQWKPFTDQTISSAIESDQRWFWAHNSLIRSDFERTIFWMMVLVWSGPWSHNRADNPGWGPDPNFRLIRLSRPKISLIRLSRPKIPLIRLSRHKRSLIRFFRPKAFWSDHLQTKVQTQIQTTTQILIRLWLDSSAFEEIMTRPSRARSIYGQTHLRLKPFMVRLKRARNRSHQTQVRLK